MLRLFVYNCLACPPKRNTCIVTVVAFQWCCCKRSVPVHAIYEDISMKIELDCHKSCINSDLTLQTEVGFSVPLMKEAQFGTETDSMGFCASHCHTKTNMSHTKKKILFGFLLSAV